MSDLIKKHAKLLQFLCVCRPMERRALIKILDPSALNAIHECNHNIIKGTVPLSTSQYDRLKRKRKHLLDLDDDHNISHLQGTARRKAISDKRKNILQKGGILPALLAPLLGAVIGPLANLGVSAIKDTVETRRKRKTHEKQAATAHIARKLKNSTKKPIKRLKNGKRNGSY